MKKLSVVAIILFLSIGISNADYTKDLEDALLKQEKIIAIQKEDISEKQQKITKLEAQKNAGYILKIPFTDAGLTTEEVKGAVWAALSITISPIFMIGFLF